MPDFQSAEKFILDTLKQNLPDNLSYHGVHHTLDVLEAALRIAAAEKISEEEIKLLRIAVLLHDSGFIHVYRGHEVRGCKDANKILPQFGFTPEQINLICGMIMSTQLPQDPHTQLERIIADADLDYLGRDDFYPVAKTLFQEFQIYLNVANENEWNHIQLNFLRNHHYHTEYSRQLREPEKQQRLKEIEMLVES